MIACKVTSVDICTLGASDFLGEFQLNHRNCFAVVIRGAWEKDGVTRCSLRAPWRPLWLHLAFLRGFAISQEQLWMCLLRENDPFHFYLLCLSQDIFSCLSEGSINRSSMRMFDTCPAFGAVLRGWRSSSSPWASALPRGPHERPSRCGPEERFTSGTDAALNDVAQMELWEERRHALWSEEDGSSTPVVPHFGEKETIRRS